MNRTRMRVQVAGLAFILLPAAAGVIGVHASATCERFVRTYVTKPVRNKVSKQTLEAWRKWGIGHPNWKPNPNVHRPKYIMTQQEALQKVDFACSSPTEPSTLDLWFTPADFDVPPPIVILPPLEATQINFPDEIPPEVAEVTPTSSWPPLAPFVPPVLNGSPGPPFVPLTPPGELVPEPPSFLLLGSGMAALLLSQIRRPRARAARPR